MKSAKLEITRFENEDVITASGSKSSTTMGYYGIAYHFMNASVGDDRRMLADSNDYRDYDDDHTTYESPGAGFVYLSKFANASDYLGSTLDGWYDVYCSDGSRNYSSDYDNDTPWSADCKYYLLPCTEHLQ